jgi:DHA1 family multidrug resistance protein-like MFS transporter
MTAHRNDWRKTTALFAATGFVESLAFGHLGAFTPLYLRSELHVPEARIGAWVGILSAIGYPLGLILLPFWAAWADRYGRKLIIIRSSFVAAIMFAIVASSQTVGMMAFARFLSGFVLGNTGVMMALQADITPKERLGWSVSIIGAGAPLAMAVGPLLGGALAEQFGLRTLIWIDAGITLVICAVLAIWLRDEPHIVEHADNARQGAKRALQSVWQTPGVPPLFTATFLVAFSLSASMPYAPMLVHKLYHGPNPAEVIGQVLTPAGIVMAAASAVWGGIGSRIGYAFACRLCIVFVIVALLGQATSHSLIQLGGFRAMQGLFQAGLGALCTLLLTDLAPPERRSAILTLSLLPNQVAWFAGPAAAAVVASYGAVWPFYLGVVAAVAGLVFTLRLHTAAPTELEPLPNG